MRGKLWLKGYRVSVRDEEKDQDVETGDDYSTIMNAFNAIELYIYKWLK